MQRAAQTAVGEELDEVRLKGQPWVHLREPFLGQRKVWGGGGVSVLTEAQGKDRGFQGGIWSPVFGSPGIMDLGNVGGAGRVRGRNEFRIQGMWVLNGQALRAGGPGALRG